MKRPRKPTRNQKKLIDSYGLKVKDWRVLRDDTELVIVSGNMEIKIIKKARKEYEKVVLQTLEHGEN